MDTITFMSSHVSEGGLDTKLHGELAALSCGYPPLRRCR
jgi:hypothetical protein